MQHRAACRPPGGYGCRVVCRPRAEACPEVTLHREFPRITAHARDVRVEVIRQGLHIPNEDEYACLRQPTHRRALVRAVVAGLAAPAKAGRIDAAVCVPATSALGAVLCE